MKRFIIFPIILMLFSLTKVFAQDENMLQHFIHYSAYDQNMWGPDSSYDIDVEHTFFDVNIDEEWGFTEITEVFGQEFGVGFVTGIDALLSSTYEAHGFNTGSFDLDYPVEITLDFPNDDSFVYGGPATISTWYDVQPGWDLTTHFPPVGVTTLDLEYMIDPYMDFVVCVFGCDTTHIIPPDMQVPYSLDTLFHINALSDPNYSVYPCWEGGEFQFCHDYNDSIVIEDWFDIGMTAWVTLPYVETEDHIDPESQCLIASGDSLYMNVHVDIIEFLHSMAGLIPPPDGDNIQAALEFLNDTIQYPFETPLGDVTANIAYELLGADFDVYNYMHQDISFCPTIWANLSFPISLPYEITDPDNGDALYEDGDNDTIAVPVGHDLTITYPCHGESPYEDSMYVGVEYDISPTITNHTWDSLAFVISIDALTVSISIETPFKKAIEADTLPGFTLPPVTGNTNEPIYAEAPAIYSPGVELEDDKNGAKDIGPWEIGPLLEWEIPIGSADLTWFHETWDMENFIQDTVFPGTYIVPFDKSELNLNMYITQGSYCYGDTLGYIYAQATDSLAPLTYHWSTGETHTGIMHSLDSLNAAPGYYSVTATDDYGCTTEDDYTVEINPPLIYDLSGTDILCHGEHTGIITASVAGGTPPYFYDWSDGAQPNGLGQDSAYNLPAGMHYVTITDWMGCSAIDSMYLSEPPTAIAMDYSSTPVSCYSDSNGSISVSPYDGTPPYSIDWDNPELVGYNPQNVPGGLYTVSITDDNGCVLEQDIEVIRPDSLVVTAVDSDITCNGDENGYVALHPEGGTAPYSYRWFHDLSIDTDSLGNLPPGFYMVSVTDSHGCEDTVSAYVTQPDSLLIDISTQNPTCHGASDGWIAFTPLGGTAPYTIDWAGHPELHNVDSVNHLDDGTYEISITDDHNCLYVESIELTEPQNLSVSFIDTTVISCNGMADGAVIASAEGGTPSYTYHWNNVPEHNDSIATNLVAGTEYYVSVTDEHGCNSAPAYITLNEPDVLELDNLSTEPVECGVAAGSGHTEADGGTPPYAFNWGNGETGSNPDSLPLGIVGITVTDDHGCTDTSSIEVGRTGSVTGMANLIEEIRCYGDSSAVAQAKLPNSFPPITYHWYNEEDVVVREGDTVYQLPAGNYYVHASDRFNCSDTMFVSVSQPDSINPGFELVSPSCSGEQDGEILTNTTGGTSPYNYAWSTGSYEPELTGIQEGYYTLTITDFFNCEASFDIALEEAEYCVTVHNTITPNGDGKNDVWYIENIEEFPYSEVWIYNRNGQEIYYKKAYQNTWNGKFNGNALPEGTYFYLIDLGNGKEVIKGYITIIR